MAARQQTKWLTFAIGVAFAAQCALFLPLEFFAVLQGNPPEVLVFNFAGTLIHHRLLLLVPVSLTNAILRQNHFEIDLIINRTLVCVPLSAILAGLYAASVVLFRNRLSALTGQQTEIAAVLSTLVIVAPISPVKEALQRAVDQRFQESALPVRILCDFELQVRERMHAVQAAPIVRRFLVKSAEAFRSRAGAAFVGPLDGRRLIRTCGDWKGEGELDIQVWPVSECFGAISLEKKATDEEQLAPDAKLLQEVAATITSAIYQDRGLAD